MPSVKISTQAIMLQMAAAKAFGEKNYAKLDPLTVSLSHPDATLAFINNTAGVNAHFSTSPFYEQEIKVPGAHLITTSYEILGGPATALVITANAKFRDANPKVLQGLLRGAEARRSTPSTRTSRAAAKLYLDLANDTKNSVQRYRRDDQRQGLRLHAAAAEGVRHRAIHGQDRLDQEGAGQDRRPVLPGSRRAQGRLSAVRPMSQSSPVFRLGTGAGFSADRLEPAVDLVERGKLDAIVLECLGERTVAFAPPRPHGRSGARL